MQLKRIKVGNWYETNAGTGICEKTEGYYPAAITVRILWPIPFGIRLVKPRDVQRELDADEAAQLNAEIEKRRPA